MSFRFRKMPIAALPDCRFQFNKRSQLFIRTHNEPVTVAAMRVGNKDLSPARIRDRRLR
jgi:hypothetical protein